METVEKKYVIRNKCTEDCYTASCNHPLLHTQCIEYLCYNKTKIKKEEIKRTAILKGLNHGDCKYVCVNKTIFIIVTSCINAINDIL